MEVPWLWRPPREGGIYQLDRPEDHVIDTGSETENRNFSPDHTASTIPGACAVTYCLCFHNTSWGS